MDVYNRRRQGVTQSEDALGRAGFTFHGLFYALADFSLHGVTRGTRNLTAFTLSYGLSLRTHLTDSLPIIGTTIVTSGMTIHIYSYVLLPEISYTSN